MADWEANGDRDVLERIVMLLFALAGLADLAAGLPALRRRHVLDILSYGEAEARAFVIGIPAGASASTVVPEVAGDAARMAARLRMLALVLWTMLTRRSVPSRTTGPRTCRSSLPLSGPAVGLPDAPAPPGPGSCALAAPHAIAPLA